MQFYGSSILVRIIFKWPCSQHQTGPWGQGSTISIIERLDCLENISGQNIQGIPLYYTIYTSLLNHVPQYTPNYHNTGSIYLPLLQEQRSQYYEPSKSVPALPNHIFPMYSSLWHPESWLRKGQCLGMATRAFVTGANRWKASSLIFWIVYFPLL